jgi:cephalosporin hydroxylase
MSFPIGTNFIERAPEPLQAGEAETLRRFHEIYYRGYTKGLSWFGHLLLKCPLDLWIYQELLVRTKPDFVVETGTWHGGSALYIAMLQDQIGHGRVVTIDIEQLPDRPEHERITYINGSSVEPSTFAKVKGLIGGGRAMIILDSDHHAPHVLAELSIYSQLVQVGDYLIVEDTNVNGHPVWPDFGPGPMEAIDSFLSENDEFAIDNRCERLLMTLNPRGYLKRIKHAAPGA